MSKVVDGKFKEREKMEETTGRADEQELLFVHVPVSTHINMGEIWVRDKPFCQLDRLIMDDSLDLEVDNQISPSSSLYYS